MSRLIDTGLEQLAKSVYRMGETANRAVTVSLNGYIKNKNTYAEVQELSNLLILVADEAENKVFELIVRFQPVASDLRILKSYMKIIYDLVRYGRYALDVSHIYDKIDGVEECEIWMRKDVVETSEKVLEMVCTSVELLRNKDVKMAESLSGTEEEVDKMYSNFLNRLIEKEAVAKKCTISSLLVMRYLERIADHAAYIGESIVYLATGEKIILR
jgi:phosphate transport system protein